MNNTEINEEYKYWLKEPPINRGAKISFALAIIALFGVCPLNFMIAGLIVPSIFWALFGYQPTEMQYLDTLIYLLIASGICGVLAIIIDAFSAYKSKMSGQSLKMGCISISIGIILIPWLFVTLVLIAFAG